MTDVVRHRGPDDEGYVLFTSHSSQPLICTGIDTPVDVNTLRSAYAPTHSINEHIDAPVTIAFGHRRLAIVDLSPLGHQPMCTPEQRFWIVFNGEIYNHIELRQELESLGHQFISHSDTEVILAAYQQWGADCLSRFNGMWAFAIYDKQEQEVFLARDRFGVKPLYYWTSPDGTFCFASEIKQFTKFPGWVAKLNQQRAYDFLAWSLTDHTDETLFAGVYQLRPGHSLRLNANALSDSADLKTRTHQWYELRAQPFDGNFDAAAAEFRRLLSDAVRLRLRADVPVGSSLSGGLDSSSIVCLMNQMLETQTRPNQQNTFSACSEVKRYDERPWIDIVVNATSVNAHYVYPPLEQLFEESRDITWHQDEPFGSTSIYAQWCVFRLAAENGVKVMLDGQGADEQLAGYGEFFTRRFVKLLRSGQLRQLWSETQDTKRLQGYSELHSLMCIADLMLPSSITQPLRGMLGKAHAVPIWLNLEALTAKSGYPLNVIGSDTVQGLSKMQLTASSLQMLLHWADRDSMAHSVEARVPFLDYRLVEFVLGLPDEFKIAGGVTKKVLRAGMKGILPDRIANRMDKLGFSTPEDVWVKENAPGVFREKLRKAVDTCDGILNENSIQLLDDMINGSAPFSYTLWRMINFGEWLNAFDVKRH